MRQGLGQDKPCPYHLFEVSRAPRWSCPTDSPTAMSAMVLEPPTLPGLDRCLLRSIARSTRADLKMRRVL